MDVRDYFAGQAINGLIKDGPDFKKEKNILKLASLAYQIADALLDARERIPLPRVPTKTIAPEVVSQSQDEKDSKNSKNAKRQPKKQVTSLQGGAA